MIAWLALWLTGRHLERIEGSTPPAPAPHVHAGLRKGWYLYANPTRTGGEATRARAVQEKRAQVPAPPSR